MGEGVEGGETGCGGILQEILEEIEALFGHPAPENLPHVREGIAGEEYSIEWMGFDLRELVFHVVGVHGPYLFFRGCSEDLDDFDELIDSRFAWEQRRP